MLSSCICTQYLVGAPFALITASIRRGMEVQSVHTLQNCYNRGGNTIFKYMIFFVATVWMSHFLF